MTLFPTRRLVAELRLQIKNLEKDNARLKAKLKEQRAEERAESKAKKGSPQ